MITLRVFLDTEDKEKILCIMHGIKSKVAYLLNDEDYLTDDKITHHFINGKVDNRQEIDISDVTKDDGSHEAILVWSAWALAIHTINTLRAHPHVKRVLIYDDESENTANFIDWENSNADDDYKEIINPIQ